LRKIGDFIYDFLVGDDWRLFAGAVGVVVAVAVLVGLGVNAWWLAPLAVPATLVWSLRASPASDAAPGPPEDRPG
jgi:hypothetical protein